MARLKSDRAARASGAVLGAACSCAIWIWIEATGLARAGESFPRSVFAAGAAGFGWIVLCAAIAFALTSALASRTGRRLLLPDLSPRVRAACLLGFFSAGSFVYVGYRAVESLFSGAGVKSIALGVSTAVFLAAVFYAGYWLAPVASSLWTRRAPRFPAPVTAVAFTAVAAAWGASFFALEREVRDAIEPLRFWPLALTVAAAVVGAAIRPRGVRVAISSATLAAGFAALAVLHVAFPGTERMGDRAAEATVATALFNAVFPFASPRTVGVGARSGGEGGLPTCRPGIAPASPGDMPKIGASAPDILWITVEALRWDHTSLDGYARDTTPNLKKRARHGAVFSRAYAPSNSTRQSFPALFTGLYGYFLAGRSPPSGGWGPVLPQGQPTIASYLSAAGYRTTALVAMRTVFQERRNALDGFDVVDYSAAVPFKKRRFAAPYLIDGAIGALAGYSPDRPRFVWAHLPEPHQPYLAGPRPVDYGKEDIDLYDSSIRFVDGELERIAAFALGPARSDETVLIIHGDHGQAFMEHGTRTHGRSVYQEETRVPLLLFGPGIGSRRVDSPVSLIDVAPTILDLAGLPPNGALCGDSLLPAIRGAGAKPDRDVFIGVLPDSKQGASILALVRGAYKIVVFPKTGRQQLYDIAADPLERRDLAAEEPAKLEEMKEALESYQRAHGMDVVNVD